MLIKIILIGGSTNLEWTTPGVVTFLVITLVSIFSHYLVIKHVRKVLDEMANINLVNSQILQKSNFDLENRRKVEMVAELFALWYQTAPAGPYTKQNNPDLFKRLNELTYQCTFWLPQNILTDVNNKLGNIQGVIQKDPKQIMVDIRTFLNPDAGAVQWQSIVHF